ncbi:hypothetical protein TMPK1_19470 [Rhodospirillales bacterium TMPK1]|uniref:Uncharacterized protein n=1 Tax=Roseiterribacter gracilis TaxID=2812848 RepID=A0A8S8XF55_9PROT|nr:hypothetical protein TMPK1_19470 [Rhodospirillales bacterium TMPK1]
MLQQVLRHRHAFDLFGRVMLVFGFGGVQGRASHKIDQQRKYDGTKKSVHGNAPDVQRTHPHIAAARIEVAAPRRDMPPRDDVSIAWLV